MCKLSFVIPCYGSENTVAQVVNDIVSIMSTNNTYEYEIVMVSDDSPDNVFAVIRKLCSSNPHMKGIELARNFGQHAALMCGYSFASGDYIVSLDDDGQSPIESVFDLIIPLKYGSDVVFGKYEQVQQGLHRKIGSAINNWLLCLMVGKPLKLKTNSFFAAKKYIIAEILRYDNSYPYLPGLLLRTTRNIVNVPVKQHARVDGQSGYTFSKLLGLWVNGFTAFSVKPLQVASVIGFVLALLGSILGIKVVVNKLVNPDIQAGYSSLMSALMFVSGIIMSMLGIIGEYIGRIYICINKSPQYVVRRVVDKEH